jgi:predicted AAA+ superfamily ATPase
MNGGKHLFIDEVHKYPFWSRELKTIHDGFPEMKIVFSASSALGIYQGEADLSRRVVTYNLPGLSFREYLSFFHGIHLPKFGLDDLLAHHTELAKNLSEDFRPLMYFEAYLTSGYYPFAKESSGIGFKIKLAQAINATIESDLAAIEGYNAGGASRLKRLLAAIAESSPFTPNISQLASKLEMSRDTVYQYLGYLENGKLVNMLMREGRGEAKFQKPDKIYLENTNLAYTLSANPDLGNLRETFLMNQLNNVTGGEVNLPSAGDFFTHGCTIEVGGSKKTKRQVKAAIKPIVAADGIEVGSTNIIPLWMFGMLY